jgi:hypothetical protein
MINQNGINFYKIKCNSYILRFDAKWPIRTTGTPNTIRFNANTHTDYGIINTWLKGNYVSIYLKKKNSSHSLED